MYYPASRVLTVLELLQAHVRLSGPELAEHLEVDVRTVRRYILRLQDLGIPVETIAGRHGGYRLRPGYRLPPMMFNDDETVALGLGLAVAQNLGLAGAVPAASGALAKLTRVMPEALREKIFALQTALTVNLPPPDFLVESELFSLLSEAIAQTRQVQLFYQSRHANQPAARTINPYGLISHAARWYLVGYSVEKAAIRVFRLDRLSNVILTEHKFERPANFDSLAYALQSFAAIPDRWDIVVRLEISLAEARQKVPPSLASLEQTSDGVILRASMPDLDWMGRFLLNLACPFTVIEPLELCEALEQIAAEIQRTVANSRQAAVLELLLPK